MQLSYYRGSLLRRTVRQYVPADWAVLQGMFALLMMSDISVCLDVSLHNTSAMRQ